MEEDSSENENLMQDGDSNNNAESNFQIPMKDDHNLENIRITLTWWEKFQLWLIAMLPAPSSKLRLHFEKTLKETDKKTFSDFRDKLIGTFNNNKYTLDIFFSRYSVVNRDVVNYSKLYDKILNLFQDNKNSKIIMNIKMISDSSIQFKVNNQDYIIRKEGEAFEFRQVNSKTKKSTAFMTFDFDSNHKEKPFSYFDSELMYMFNKNLQSQLDKQDKIELLSGKLKTIYDNTLKEDRDDDIGCLLYKYITYIKLQPERYYMETYGVELCLLLHDNPTFKDNPVHFEMENKDEINCTVNGVQLFKINKKKDGFSYEITKFEEQSVDIEVTNYIQDLKKYLKEQLEKNKKRDSSKSIRKSSISSGGRGSN